MYLGYSIEMATGSGKTFVGLLSCILKHQLDNIVPIFSTINDTLLERDVGFLRRIVSNLDKDFAINVGKITHKESPQEKTDLYSESDIICTTYSTLTFDYLTNIVASGGSLYNIPLDAICLDELDYCLIDMAMVPHIISLPIAELSDQEKELMHKIHDFVVSDIINNKIPCFQLVGQNPVLNAYGKKLISNKFFKDKQLNLIDTQDR